MPVQFIILVVGEHGKHVFHASGGVDHVMQKIAVQNRKAPLMTDIDRNVETVNTIVVDKGPGQNLDIDGMQPQGILRQYVTLPAIFDTSQAFQNGLHRSAVTAIRRATATRLHFLRKDAAQGFTWPQTYETILHGRLGGTNKWRISIHDLSVRIGQKNHERHSLQPFHMIQLDKLLSKVCETRDGQALCRGEKSSHGGVCHFRILTCFFLFFKCRAHERRNKISYQ
ncbi:hypothetical protein [Desulfomicrobium norvegicum]|uniref:hypothetical protein n=1 Tax=Desulfomicrobium norvegicum (strain DSM 1741 / NCIMB 8310) TaxID=52561 RepID=UPI00137A32F0|nr:hypothetical protein [Desulfomicrobium norvegicum]